MAHNHAESFNDRAKEWDSPPRVAMADALLTALRAAVQLPEGIRVLDYGAGTGLLAVPLAQAGAVVTAADLSTGMLDVLKAKIAVQPGLTVTPHLLADETPLPGGFHLVLCSMALHHMEDVPAVLAAFRAALVPGGRVALFDLDEDNGEFHGDQAGVHHDGFARPTLAMWLMQAGFNDVVFKTAHAVRRAGRDGVEREFTIFLATGMRV